MSSGAPADPPRPGQRVRQGGAGPARRRLAGAGVEVVSTGSTATALEGHGLRVTRVEELTGFPELLDGRVKTLHPRVHAGLLADRGKPGHRSELDAAGIAPFDLVVVNLYPFEETVADPDADPALAVERIDVGGPAMVRAAAKNHAWVAVVCDPADYSLVESALTAGGTTLPERRTLAARAFARTAAYDTAVTTWMGQAASGFPERLAVGGLLQALRYGENPHQGRPSTRATGPRVPGGWGRRPRSPARSCPTTTCSTPTPPWLWPPSTGAARSRPSSSTPTRAGRRSGRPSRRRTPAPWTATR